MYYKVHYDADQNMNCLYHGTKEWIFLDTHKYWKDIVWVNGRYHAPKVRGQRAHTGTDFSPFDPHSVDMEAYPSVKDLRYQRVTQRAGDCIYIPNAYMHQVTKPNAEHNVAVSYMFLPTEEYSENVCADAPAKTPIPLSNFDITYFYS